MDSSVRRIAVPASTVSAIQRNVEAHTPWSKYRDLFDGPDEELPIGVSVRKLRALALLTSTAECFEIEFSGKMKDRSPKKRAEAAGLREALAILRKAQRELDAEIFARVRPYVDPSERLLRIA